jgi:hypothetical protein
MSVINPLTDKHCEALDCVLASIPNIRDTIQACEDCGMDFSAEKQRMQAQQEFAAKVKQKFNPLAK